MGAFFKKLFGFIHVEEFHGGIRIHGVRTKHLAADIMRLWGTSRVEQFMFLKFTGKVIEFSNFFAPDVHYVLRTLLQAKYARTSRSDIRSVLKQMEENTWMKNIDLEQVKSKLDYSRVSLFHKKPMPHQMGFFDAYDKRTQAYGLNGYILSAAPGTGKTLTSLILAEMLHADIVIMVVPKNTVYRVWKTALEKEYIKSHAGEKDLWVLADGQNYKGQRFIISHYEALEKTVKAVGSGRGKVVVVLDESHNLTGDESLRTQMFIQLCKNTKASDVIWSSGTPFKAMGQEVIPILHTIDPMFTMDDEARYRKIYGKSAQRALDILRNRIGVISYRVEKGEVSTSKPKSTNINVEIPNGKEYTIEHIRDEMKDFVKDRTKYYERNKREYEKIFDRALDVYEDKIKTKEERKDFDLYRSYIKQIRKGYDPRTMGEMVKFCNAFEKKNIQPALPKELNDQFKKAKGIIKYMALVVMGECLGTVLGKKRAKCHAEMIPEIGLEEIIDNAQSKTVIFTSYVEVVKTAEAYLKSKGYNPIVVYSGPGMDLAKNVGAFDGSDDINPLITTYQSLSTGVPLVMANTSVFVNQPWRSFEKEQAEARTDRLGQQFAVEYFNTYLNTGKEPNISTRAKEIIEWSAQQVELLTGQKVAIDLTAGLEAFHDALDADEQELEQTALELVQADISFEAYLDTVEEIEEAQPMVAEEDCDCYFF